MSELAELEQEKLKYMEVIGRMQIWQKLQASREWQLLMEKGFMQQDCVHYIHASVDTAILKEQREEAMKMAQASGYLKKFLEVVEAQGRYAENRLTELEQAIEEARSNAQ